MALADLIFGDNLPFALVRASLAICEVTALSKVRPHAEVGALQLQVAAAPPHRRCAAKHMRRGCCMCILHTLLLHAAWTQVNYSTRQSYASVPPSNLYARPRSPTSARSWSMAGTTSSATI
eukprot:5735074-Pleurochrysis_carterae.AAC.1